MATFKDMEDNLKSFIMHEQSDAHNVKTMNAAKYNNIKIWMDPSKYQQPLVLKWFGRYGIKDKLTELSNYAEKTKDEDSK